MSGLAGILRFDGGPVDAGALAAMVEAIAHRGSEPATSWQTGPVGLAACLRRTTPRAVAEVQPCLDPATGTCLVLDGRIDDATEVRAALGPDRDLLRDHSDAELALRAFLRWGTDAFARLIGDFAVVVWDGRRQELVAARDPMAQRPLHYLRDRRPGIDSLRVASEPVGALADRGIAREANPAMVAMHLAGDVTSTTETFFTGLLRLPPGHALVARPDGTVLIQPTWTWDPATAVPRRGTTARQDAEHVAQLRDLITTTVAAHVDAPDPIAAELSGGIDSSTVVGFASEALRAAGRPGLELVSLVMPGHRYDETSFIRDVAADVGRPVLEHVPQPLGAAHFEDEIRRTLLPPAPPNVSMVEATTRVAVERGCRVLLAGHGGDEWLSGSRYALADDLRGLRLRGLRARARDDRTLWPARTAVHHLVRDGLLPLLGRPYSRVPSTAHLPARFRSEVDLDRRLRQRDRPAGPSVATAAVAAGLRRGQTIYEREQAERAYARWGVERRSPLDDRRVLELALRMPDDVRRRGLATKWALRKASEGLVPDSVRHRGWKTGFGDVLVEELRAQGCPGTLGDLAIADLGWVDPGVLRRAWENGAVSPDGRPPYSVVWATWNTVWTDRWYRATFCA